MKTDLACKLANSEWITGVSLQCCNKADLVLLHPPTWKVLLKICVVEIFQCFTKTCVLLHVRE